MNREELEAQLAEVDALERLAAAKEAHRAKGSEATRAALHDAKLAVGEARAARRALAGEPSGGEARPDTVRTKVKGA
jgi:hypothetical protein